MQINLANLRTTDSPVWRLPKAPPSSVSSGNRYTLYQVRLVITKMSDRTVEAATRMKKYVRKLMPHQ